MKSVKKIGIMIPFILFTGCEIEKSSYKTTEIVHNEYYYKMLKDPNYKIDVQNLDLVKDIEKGNIFCYDNAKTSKDKYKIIVSFLRELPIECDDTKALKGPSKCVIDNILLDNAAKEHSNDMAATKKVSEKGSNTSSDLTASDMDLQRGSVPQERAQYNGYYGKYLLESSTIQNDNSKYAIAKMIQKSMKSKKGYCSMLMDNKVLHIGVESAKSDGKTYWTFLLGDNRDKNN